MGRGYANRRVGRQNSDPPASSDSLSDPTALTSEPPSFVDTAAPPVSDPASTIYDPSTSSPSPSSDPLLTSSIARNTAPITPSPVLSSTPTESLNMTVITTSVGGVLTTYTSQLPTSISDVPANRATGPKTSMIVGATIAGFFVLLSLLGGIFAYRWYRMRRSQAREGDQKGVIKRKLEGGGLLYGEEPDDEGDYHRERRPMHMREMRPSSTASYRSPNSESYHYMGGQDHDFPLTTSPDTDGPLHPPTFPRPISPAPSLLKTRTSESGSIFREEGVWPPPGGAGFVDPIQNMSSQVDLSGIVEGVMGPGPGALARSQNRKQQRTQSLDLNHDTGFQHRKDLLAEMADSTTPLMAQSPSVSHYRDRNSTLSSWSSEAYSDLYRDPIDPHSQSQLQFLGTPGWSPSHHSPRRPDSVSIHSPFASVSIGSALPPGAGAPVTPGLSPTWSETEVVQPPPPPPTFIPPSSYSPSPPLMPQRPASIVIPASSSSLSNPNLPRRPLSEPNDPYPSTSRSLSPPFGKTPSPNAARIAQPKKSSPLARVLSGDARIWLGRHIRPSAT